MAKGAGIIVTSPPRGVFIEGVAGDTSLPGTILQVKPATAFQGPGRATWVALGSTAALGADGAPALIAVLVENDLMGLTPATANVVGQYCKVYCPLAGEEMNVLVGESAGTTGNNFAIGDRLMMDTDSGNAIPASGSPASVPFISMEKATAVAEPYLLNVIYTGH